MLTTPPSADVSIRNEELDSLRTSTSPHSFLPPAPTEPWGGGVGLTSGVVALAVAQPVELRPRPPRPGHPEEQRVGLDRVRVAGFKLAAGDQQGREGGRLGLEPGPPAPVGVQRNLLLSRGDLLDGTADVLHRSPESGRFQRQRQEEETLEQKVQEEETLTPPPPPHPHQGRDQHTFLFL